MTANAIDLTQLVNVKQRAEVGVQPNGTIIATNDDNEIQAAITGFSQRLLDWTGRASLNSITSQTDTYSGQGTNRLFLRQRPIQTVQSLTVNNVNVQQSINAATWGYYIEDSLKSLALRGGGSPIGFSSNWYAQSYGGGGGRGLFRTGLVFPFGTGNISVQYSAGYPPLTVSNEIDTVNANTITLQQAPWVADGGVLYYPSLVPLAVVNNSPTVGQYAVSNGLYVFNSGDSANAVAVTYNINSAPYDLEYAVRCVVAINYKRKGWQDQGSRTVNARETATTVSYRSWDFPKEFRDIFEHYIRRSPN